MHTDETPCLHKLSELPRAARILAFVMVGAVLLFSLAPAQSANPVKLVATTFLCDYCRSGVNANESIPIPTNARSGTFGALPASAIDGQTYARPLSLSRLIVAAANAGTWAVAVTGVGITGDGNSGAVTFTDYQAANAKSRRFLHSTAELADN